MACKLCKLEHPGHVMCKAHAAKIALQQAKDAKLLATVKPPVIANTAPIANEADAPQAIKETLETYKRYKDKDARRAYMRAYMAKRRTV